MEKFAVLTAHSARPHGTFLELIVTLWNDRTDVGGFYTIFRRSRYFEGDMKIPIVNIKVKKAENKA